MRPATALLSLAALPGANRGTAPGLHTWVLRWQLPSAKPLGMPKGSALWNAIGTLCAPLTMEGHKLCGSRGCAYCRRLIELRC